MEGIINPVYTDEFGHADFYGDFNPIQTGLFRAPRCWGGGGTLYPTPPLHNF